MADYLGDKGVPVALVMPFDGTQSFPAPGNVARVVNFTQRDYAYMRPGPGFRGSLNNVDLSSNRHIDHLNIDKSPELHARVLTEVLAVIGGRLRENQFQTVRLQQIVRQGRRQVRLRQQHRRRYKNRRCQLNRSIRRQYPTEPCFGTHRRMKLRVTQSSENVRLAKSGRPPRNIRVR
jgi:hypothetical protein